MWDPSRFRSGKTARKGKVPGNYAKNLSDKGSEYHRKSPGLSGLVWHTRACPRRPGKGNHREVKPTWGPLPHSANGCSPGGSQPVRYVWSLRGWRWDAASLLPSPDELRLTGQLPSVVIGTGARASDCSYPRRTRARSFRQKAITRLLRARLTSARGVGACRRADGLPPTTPRRRPGRRRVPPTAAACHARSAHRPPRRGGLGGRRDTSEPLHQPRGSTLAFDSRR